MSVFKKSTTLIGHQHPIYAIATSSKEHIVFTAGGEGAVVEWSLKKKAFLKLLFKMNASIYALHCPKQPNVLIAGDRSGFLQVFDFALQKVVFSHQSHHSAIFDIQSSENYFYSVGEDGHLNIYEFGNYKHLDRIEVSKQSIRSICINESKDELILTGKDLLIYAISKSTLQIKKHQSNHSLGIFVGIFDSTQQKLFTAARDAQMMMWNPYFELEKSIPAHLFAINDLLLLPAKDLLISASMDKTVKVWDSKTHKLYQILDAANESGHHKSVNAIAFTDFENSLISVGDDRQVIVWNC